jgi:RsiW-degrading membrane proteinase PrsW (M82 family)
VIAMPAAPAATAMPVVQKTARAAIAVLCIVGVAVQAWEWAPVVRVFPGPALLAVILQLPLLGLGFWLIRRLRPIRAPARSWSAVAVIWGLTAAAGFAELANHGLTVIWARAAGVSFASSWAAPLSAPLNEEILKLCGVVLIVVAAPLLIRGPVDGLVFGALAGLGFEATENIAYGLNAIAQFGATSPPEAVYVSAVLRDLAGPGSHWAISAVAGAGIGYLVARGRRGAVPGLALVVAAMLMHLLADAPGISEFVKVIVNFAAVTALYLFLRRGYLARARDVMAAWTASGAMTADEAAILLRRRARQQVLRQVPSIPHREQLAARWTALLAQIESPVMIPQPLLAAAPLGPPAPIGPPPPLVPPAPPGMAGP